MKDAPLITVNVVTQNRKSDLLLAIESAYAQTYRPIEVVVVDNASSDGSAEAVEERWPEVRVIRLHRNIGCQPGRNIGMANAKGKYIFNLDDDGILEQNALGLIVARFEAEDDLAVICASTPPLETMGQPLTSTELPRYMGMFRGGASAIRRSALPVAGYFPDYPRAGSEHVFALQVIEQGYFLLMLPQAIMFHPLDRKGRILKVHSFYEAWHVLKTSYMLYPFPECFFFGLWRSLRGIQVSLTNGCFFAYTAGLLRFLFDLPDVVAGRRPLSRATLKKQIFLITNNIYNKSDSTGYSTRSAWQRLKDRWLHWGRRKKERKAGRAT